MKKISIFFTFVIVGMVASCSGCKDQTKPVSEIVARAWSAQVVRHGSPVVYTKGATSNTVPGYTNFRLDLSSPTSATLKEFDNNSFTGTWEVTEASTGNKLTLKNLNPRPTGTDGTIEFTINSASETALSLTRTTASQKTGATINSYDLVSP